MNVYITHTTKNYIKLTEKLLKSISEFSKFKIICYTINFDWDLNYKNVITIRYNDNNIENSILYESDKDKLGYVDRRRLNIFKILTLKQKLILKSFNDGVTNGIYLDSDIIANYNIDNLYQYFNIITNYPLLPLGIWDIMKYDNKIHIEQPLMKLLNVKKRYDYLQSCIILYNKNCTPFINEWINTNNNKTILSNVEYYAPFQDETIANVLLWKYNYTNHLPSVSINILNFNTVKFIDNFKENGEIYRIYEKDTGNGWQLIPYPKNIITCYHGCKIFKECDKIIDYIKIKKHYFDTLISRI